MNFLTKISPHYDTKGLNTGFDCHATIYHTQDSKNTTTISFTRRTMKETLESLFEAIEEQYEENISK